MCSCGFSFPLQAGVWREAFPWHLKSAMRLTVITQNSVQSSCRAGRLCLKLLYTELEKSSWFQSIPLSEKVKTGRQMLIWILSNRGTYILRNTYLSVQICQSSGYYSGQMLLNSLRRTKGKKCETRGPAVSQLAVKPACSKERAKPLKKQFLFNCVSSGSLPKRLAQIGQWNLVVLWTTILSRPLLCYS